MVSLRYPAFAGTFYAGDPDQLRRQIETCFRHPLGPGLPPPVPAEPARRLAGLVTPHAGYVYSGPVAAHAYAALGGDGRPDVVVLIGPNHYGLGPPVAVSPADYWLTPLGALAVDREVARATVAALPEGSESEVGHYREHSLEVQLPFLQYLYGEAIRIVPISVGFHNLASAELLGRAVAAAVAGRDAVIVASTDLTHYQPHEVAMANDRKVLAAMGRMDAAGLLRLAPREVSMCGPAPVAAALVACRALGADEVSLLKHATSGEVTGDLNEVVAYASLSIARPARSQETT